MLGSLISIITSELLTTKAVKFTDLCVINKKIYVVETRPEDKGRSVIYSLSDEKDILQAPYSAKNGVHEYGGKTLCGDKEAFYFTNKKDGQIYKIANDKTRKLTDSPKMRFAEPTIYNDYIFSVFEDHSDEETIKNGIMRIHKDSGKLNIIESEHDFYAGVRISPNGKYLAYFTWDFPNMSWDEADVWKISLSDTQEVISKKMISQKGDTSSCDPIFTEDNQLLFISDETGFWNIYNENGSCLLNKDADFTKPHWKLGNKLYTPISEEKIATVFTENAIDRLGVISNNKLDILDLPFSTYMSLIHSNNKLYFIAASPSHNQGVFSYDLNSKELIELKSSKKNDLDESWISIPSQVAFETRHNETSYGFFYPPKNPNYDFGDEKPPLLLISHGGPTGHNPPQFSLEIQYWTSRGFAVVDVNYSGSTGFGRKYRNRLYGNWGIKDVDDCEDCALFLAKEGLVDGNRMVVRGGSAGGYTTLALLTFRDSFVAGASYFGVSDIGMLVEDTHKFESQYFEKIVGKYPEDKAIYDERSPLHHTDKLKKPILILQGSEDKVVPQNQAEKMYKALLEKNIPTAYLLFEGEGHGFVQKKNIIKSIDSELYFYQTIFNQKQTFETPPLIIDNVKSLQ
ncbi:MAG: hypothetical protein S4CHLAM20_08770 [Chlamydiia bacterium]|nr:hypothetical protein [Chlamydiia bacterium]